MISEENKFERMFFPSGTWALILDTNKPVFDHFAHNICAYCTGVPGNMTVSYWQEKFFKDMCIDPKDQFRMGTNPVWNNPFLRFGRHGWSEKKYWTPASPWPTPGYASNGLFDLRSHVDVYTFKNLLDEKMDQMEVLETFVHPAHMSVAIFFSRPIHELQVNIITARAKQFCKDSVYTGHRKITKVAFQLIS